MIENVHLMWWDDYWARVQCAMCGQRYGSEQEGDKKLVSFGCNCHYHHYLHWYQPQNDFVSDSDSERDIASLKIGEISSSLYWLHVHTKLPIWNHYKSESESGVDTLSPLKIGGGRRRWLGTIVSHTSVGSSEGRESSLFRHFHHHFHNDHFDYQSPQSTDELNTSDGINW